MPKTPGLRELRNRAALSQEELAEASGISRATIADLEAGNRGAWPKTIRQLAEALSVEPEDLYREPDSPKVEASPSQPSFYNHLAEERRAAETSQELEHLREHVIATLGRWESVARGDDPTLRIDYTYSIEVWNQTASLMEWLTKLLPEVSSREERQIIGLIDELYNVATEVNAAADANEGITTEQREQEAEALIDAEVQAVVANQRPDDEVARQRAEERRRRYVKMREETQRIEQRAAEVKRQAVSE
jgi:transcriptional regulator with XRE-family HTH domain